MRSGSSVGSSSARRWSGCLLGCRVVENGGLKYVSWCVRGWYGFVGLGAEVIGVVGGKYRWFVPFRGLRPGVERLQSERGARKYLDMVHFVDLTGVWKVDKLSISHGASDPYP